jgi:hypothetical protein
MRTHARARAQHKGSALGGRGGRGRHGRRIPDVDELLRLPAAVKAGLRREEVIAVVLYSGPMVRGAPRPLPPPLSLPTSPPPRPAQRSHCGGSLRRGWISDDSVWVRAGDSERSIKLA